MNIPSFKLHSLKGKLAGHWSVWVKENWWISIARAWMMMQADYDLWQAMQHDQPPIRRLQEAAAA